jgi:thiamine biosynthesis lipoprotein
LGSVIHSNPVTFGERRIDLQERRSFAREAMAALFQITVAEPDPVYAGQAAAAALDQLERIESRLSRFVETSDVFRINRLAPGETTTVHPDTFECLQIALQVQAATGRAFNVAYASAVRPDDGQPIELIEPGCAVCALADRVQLDLGAIGKGFALDRMAALLAEWDVGSALLSASTSSLLALAPPPGQEGWAIHVGPDHAPRRLLLANQAIGASGTAVRGAHIIDPRTGQPAAGKFRTWALAPTAAEADALSTAFMVMTDDEVADYCRLHPGIEAYLLKTPVGELLTMPS